MIGVTCKSCAYFAPGMHTDAQRSQCRKRSPLVFINIEHKPQSAWPMVSRDAFCGDHAVFEGQEAEAV